MSTNKVNTRYKDKLFRALFGGSAGRENIISLYNAINGTEYSADKDFEITTLEDVIYIRMKNDVSLLIDSCMTLWEQQSTYSPNMPLRGHMYFGELYSGFIEKNKYNIYGSKLIKIPTPQYIVFYNGQKDIEPVKKFKLSDSFINERNDGEFEWTATMYNLNKGKNEGLLDKCKPLKDYMTLINYIRDNLADDMPIATAIDEAVQRCISEDVLAEFLSKNRSEVLEMCLKEYDEEVFVNTIHAEGYTEGKSEGRLEQLVELVKEGLLMIDTAVAKTSLTKEEFQKLL